MTKVADSFDPTAAAFAADLIARHQTIGFFNRSVCALLGNADTEAFRAALVRIKGEHRKDRPVGSFMPSDEIAAMADAAKVTPGLATIVCDADELRERLAGLCFIRVPVRADAAAAMPAHVLSRRADGAAVFMGGDPLGYPPLELLWRETRARGVRILAGTSMNRSHSPEIVEQADGIAFAEAAGLPFFLRDRHDRSRVKGSPTVLSLDPDGVRLVRDGFIPVGVFERLLSCPIKTDGARASHNAQIALDPELVTWLPPRELRRYVLSKLSE